VNFTLTDLLPEKLGVAEKEDHVWFFEANWLNMLLELVGPAEAFSNISFLVFKSHFGVLWDSKA
jgi:hypothetical protein